MRVVVSHSCKSGLVQRVPAMQGDRASSSPSSVRPSPAHHLVMQQLVYMRGCDSNVMVADTLRRLRHVYIRNCHHADDAPAAGRAGRLHGQHWGIQVSSI